MSEAKNKKMTETDDAAEILQLIVFKQGSEEYALHIDQIKEVVITPHITKMPQTPSFIKGVANIRGNIIAIVDLEEKFGIKENMTTDAVNENQNYTLVIESNEIKMGLLVRDVPNTLSVKSAEIEMSVNIVQNEKSESDYIRGIVKLDNRLIILIDVHKAISQNELGKVALESAG